jgi:nucleoside phosphorylase
MIKIKRSHYKIGDLVRVKETTYYYMDETETFPENLGIIVGQTSSWYEAFEHSREDIDDTKTHYWDNVNYSPYRVLMCGSHELEWVSEEHMELAYKEHA